LTRAVCILGATGTIGRNTLDVIGRHPERFRVHSLTAYRDVQGMVELCQQYRPEFAAMADAGAASALADALAQKLPSVRVEGGADAVAALAGDASVDIVMSAIVGAAGLLPTLAAVRAGHQVLLANKEPLVMAGTLLLEAARRHQAVLLPVDSEHNAIFQCLPTAYRCGETPRGVRRLVLTASGGPFRTWTLEQIAAATPEQALRHPNWVMGPKITIDSASLMNKGLELIEAARLYQLDETRVDVVIHPESAIHSLVEFVDGSMLAQIGRPDMRVPIAHSLAWPERVESGVGGLDLLAAGQFRFEAPDEIRFPCLSLARAALRAGGQATNVLNAANEVAVQAFIDRRMGFGDIPRLIEYCLDRGQGAGLAPPEQLENILAADDWARQQASEWVTRHGTRGTECLT